MVKVMNFSVVFFTRKYLTNNKNGEGSGQFSHSHDLKPDQILSSLIENGLLVGGNFIKNARNRNEEFKYSSFRKQLPSVIQNNPRIKQAFEVNIIFLFTLLTRSVILHEERITPTIRYQCYALERATCSLAAPILSKK